MLHHLADYVTVSTRSTTLARNTFDQKRISTNPNSNLNRKAQ